MKNFAKVVSLVACLSMFLVFALGSGSSGDSGSADKEISSANVESEDGNSPVAGSTSETESVQQANVQTEYHVGDILQDGDMKIVYMASGVYAEDNEFLQPKEGYEYIFLEFAFINESNSDKTISSFSFDAYADGYAVDMYYGGENDLSATLSAGRQTSGAVYFEVPVDATEIEVEYETNFFTEKKIHFIYDGDKDSGYVLEASTSRTESAYSVGDVIEGTNLIITYLSCEEYVSDNQFIQPKQGYHFVSLELEFENTGSGDKSISVYSFDCYADGNACDQNYSRDDALSATISAGRKAKGTVTFEVPDEAEVIEVEYNDNVWTSSRIVFTVQ